MNKLFTSAMAFAMLASASTMNASSLRDQVVGSYTGGESGYEWLIQYGATYNWEFTQDNPVVIEAGEADDAIVIKNFFRNDNAHLNDLNATVVATDGVDGYLGYINIPAQACGTVDYMTYGTYNAYFHGYYNSEAYLDVKPEGDAQFWITTDGKISSYATGWAVIMDYYGNGSAYYNTLVGYSQETLTKEEGATVNALRDQILGNYGGGESGYEWLIQYGATYNWEFNQENPVVIAAGEGADDIVIKNFFRNENAHLNDLNATVVAVDNVEGYLGYINIPAQACGTVDYMTYGTYNAYFHGYYNSEAYLDVKPEGDAQFWITTDGKISSYATGWAVIMDYYGNGSAYYNTLVGYSQETLVKLEEEGGNELRDQLIGKYTGGESGYEWLVQYGATYNWEFTQENPVEIAAGEGADGIVIKNFFRNENAHLNDLTATVVATEGIEGYLGYINVPAQACGTVDYMTYGTYNAYFHGYYNSEAYLDVKPEGDAQFWITSDGGISTYATGWAVIMDYYGNGSAYYNTLVGYSQNTLTKASEDSVQGVAVEDENAPIEYYNFGGMKVNGDNLAPGMYIMRQGSKTTKILVK